jgi:hypothetical protein
MWRGEEEARPAIVSQRLQNLLQDKDGMLKIEELFLKQKYEFDRKLEAISNVGLMAPDSFLTLPDHLEIRSDYPESLAEHGHIGRKLFSVLLQNDLMQTGLWGWQRLWMP